MRSPSWVKRVSLGLGLALFGVLAAGPPVGATSVEANPGLEGSVACSTDSNGNPIQVITWIVTNFNVGTDMTIQAISLTQGTLVPNPGMSGDTFAVGEILPAGQAAWANTTLPGGITGTDTLTVTGTWPDSNNYTSTNSVTVNLTGCGGGGGGTPDVSITKTADAASVPAGQPVGYTIGVCSDGSADATGVVLNDPLPAGAGGDLDWTVDTSTPDHAYFQITGAQGSQVLGFSSSSLTLPAGTCLSVHITSPTSVADGAGAKATGFDSAGTAAAGYVSLGSARAYAVLGLQKTSINNSNVTVSGDMGVSQAGKLTNMAPSTINGNVFEYAAGQYSGPGKLNGSVTVNPTLLTQNDSDALAAAAAASGLTPTQTFGSIGTPTTITGGGGLNVIRINGNITQSVTLSGPADAVFIVNVSGNVSLGGSSALGIAGGVTANHVLYNFTGSSGKISTHIGNVITGTVLAPTYSLDLDGAFLGELIGGGPSLTLMSGAKVSGTGGSVTNTATVSFGSTDPTPSDNTASATITLQ